MNYRACLLKIIDAPHISEKSTITNDKCNTVVFRVSINSDKKKIKDAVELLFKVKVNSVNTLIIKGKKMRYHGRLGSRNNVKKAYVTLKKNQKIDLIGKTK